MLRQTKWLWATGLGLCLGASGCANFVEGSEPVQTNPDDDPSTPGLSDAANGKALSAALLQAADCPDLLTKLQADAVAKVDLEVVRYKRDEGRYGGGGTVGGPLPDQGFADAGIATPSAPTEQGGEWVDEDTSNGGGSFGGTTGATTGGTSTGGTTGGSDGATNGGSGEFEREPVADPVGGSDTNNQVREVDEADFVKMVQDRTRFYLLHGSQLFAFDSWPADALSQLGEPLALEGSPSEMFVRDGKAVVFSTVDRYALAVDSKDRYQGFTKLTVIDLSNDGMTVERELYVEGWYTSSRRYDDFVRVVLQADSPAPTAFYPEIDTHDVFGNPYPADEIDMQLMAWRDRVVASIEATELSDWLPEQFEKIDGQLVALPPECPNHYTPAAGAAAAGLTRVLGLSMQDVDADFSSLTVMGSSGIVYSNVEAMVLAQNDYRWDAMDFGLIDEQRVAVHVFDIDGEDTHYTASGWAPGHVGNQFSLDEQDGVVRMSTTGWVRVDPEAGPEDFDFWNSEPENQVLTMKAADGALEVLDTTGPIGKEGETIQSTRFLGDRAYVVTFRQTDPLIVVDMSKPKALEVLGELEIPGFSEYIHPLDENHLLTVGQAGDDIGLTGGISLQIFDVEDPTAPSLVHRHDFSANSWSSASWDHKAFTFYDAQGLLALPIVDWGSDFDSTLQVLHVSAEDGFEPLGAVSHRPLMQDCIQTYTEPGGYTWTDFYCGYEPEVRRGMFVEGEDETFVYTVSYAGVTAHAVEDLATPVAAVQLPEPLWNDYYYGYPDEGDWFGGEDDVAFDAGVPVQPTEGVAMEADGGASVAVDEAVDG